jgi:protein-disulfide isomerase
MPFTISPISRRAVLAAGGLMVAAAATGSMPFTMFEPAEAQRRDGPAEVPVDELMKAGDLPDLVYGPADAKVTIVEYASMTCGHCANFHTKIFPELKTKYIDTGKVRFVFREFPLDNLAAAASMLARCAGEGKALPMVSVLFAKQDQWAFARGNPVPQLFEIAKQAGFTQESFDKCLTDQALLDKVIAGRSRASATFGVTSTPTFFINGKRLQGGGTMSDFDKALEPLLKSS